MTQKRIHKTLEEVEAENEFTDLHQALSTGTATAQFDDDDSDGDESGAHDFDELESATEELLSTTDEEPARPRRRISHRTRPKPQSRPGVPVPLTIAGTLVMLGGFGLSVVYMLMPDRAIPIADTLASSGLTPGLIVTMGVIILSVVAIVRRHQQTVQGQLLALAENGMDAEHLEYLVECQKQSLDRRPASGEELEQVLHTLARQDEKINNLTKALKMYGKPLVDVNRQAADNGQKTKALSTQIAQLKEAIDSVGDKMSAAMLEPITQQLGKVSRESTEEVMKAVELSSQQVKADVSKCLETMPKDRGNHEVLQTLERELGRLNHTLAQVRAAAPVADSAPAYSAPTSSPAVAASSPRSSHDASVGSESSSPASGEGPAQKISGTSKSSGKSVLGAIAKLRKMR